VSLHSDYFLTLSSDGHVLVINQLSKKSSRIIFEKKQTCIKRAVFHPTQPALIVCCHDRVFIYDLQQQCFVTKLMVGTGSLTRVAMHPTGEHLLVGSKESKLAWFDLASSSSPQRIISSHTSSIQGVCFHPTLPLFASASIDGTVHIFHGMVKGDVMSDPLIVPLKILRGNNEIQFGCFSEIMFHPFEPWIFICGNDNNIVMFGDD